MGFPYVKRENRAEQDMASADFGHQMPQAFRREDDRIAVQLLPEILAGAFLNRLAVLAGLRTVIRTAKVRSQVAATVSSADLDSRMTIESSLEDQMRESHCGFQGMANNVVQITVPLKLQLPSRGSHRVNKNQDSQLLGLGPERIKLWRRERLLVDAGSDLKSPHPQLLDGVFHLLDCQIGMLQRQRTERDKAIRVGGTHRDDLFVLTLDDPARQGSVRPVGVTGNGT